MASRPTSASPHRRRAAEGWRASAGAALEVDAAARPAVRAPRGPARAAASEQLFVAVLRAAWIGVLDDASFRDACMSAGMSARTFARATACAVLAQGPGGIWFLRGTRVSPLTAAALRFAKNANAQPSWTDGF